MCLFIYIIKHRQQEKEVREENKINMYKKSKENPRWSGWVRGGGGVGFLMVCKTGWMKIYIY